MIASSISDQVLITVNTIELFGIVYLAIAVSNLRAALSRLEGRYDQYTANHNEVKEDK